MSQRASIPNADRDLFAAARWMEGQFGLENGGGPGSVWKIDGTTGSVSLFANIESDGKPNAGPGLGGIAYDPRSQQLFVTDLETGLIHRLGTDAKLTPSGVERFDCR